MNIRVQTVFVGIVSVAALLHGPAELDAQRAQAAPPQAAQAVAPSFKVMGRDGPTLGVVVPPDTTEAQLVALINSFRTARTSGLLGKLIPPTTPGGSGGPYGIVVIYVFSDPAWATREQLHAFINPTSSTISESEKAFGRNIRAFYNYTVFGRSEIGSIGYEDEGHVYTTTYRKLF